MDVDFEDVSVPIDPISHRFAAKYSESTPCTSLGKRTGGGFNLFRVDVSHGLATAGSSCVLQTAMILGSTAGHQNGTVRRAAHRVDRSNWTNPAPTQIRRAAAERQVWRPRTGRRAVR